MNLAKRPIRMGFDKSSCQVNAGEVAKQLELIGEETMRERERINIFSRSAEKKKTEKLDG